jgi:hypothetical protein
MNSHTTVITFIENRFIGRINNGNKSYLIFLYMTLVLDS